MGGVGCMSSEIPFSYVGLNIFLCFVTMVICMLLLNIFGFFRDAMLFQVLLLMGTDFLEWAAFILMLRVKFLTRARVSLFLISVVVMVL
jgi:hypothetical protein